MFSLLVPTSVAVHSTSLGNTAQPAQGQVSWPVGSSPSKVLLPGSAAEQVPHQPVRSGLDLPVAHRADGSTLSPSCQAIMAAVSSLSAE